MSAVNPDDMIRFAEAARPGDRRVYARGAMPPPALVAAMRPLVEAGVLAPVRKREGAEFLFMVQRTSAACSPARVTRPAARRGKVRVKRAKTAQTAVFECLCNAARRGLPCPTYDELAQVCGLAGRESARNRVRRMVALGWVAVEDRSPLDRNRVTILKGRFAGRVTGDGKL